MVEFFITVLDDPPSIHNWYFKLTGVEFFILIVGRRDKNEVVFSADRDRLAACRT